jgi:putative membrane protein
MTIALGIGIMILTEAERTPMLEAFGLDIAQFIVLAQDGDGDHMDFDGGWWIVMGLGMILFWGLLVLGIVWLVRELSGRGPRAARSGSEALEILDRRLAEGEISIEEHEQRRKALLRGPG